MQQRSTEKANWVIQPPYALHPAHLAGSCFWLKEARHPGRLRATRRGAP